MEYRRVRWQKSGGRLVLCCICWHTDACGVFLRLRVCRMDWAVMFFERVAAVISALLPGQALIKEGGGGRGPTGWFAAMVVGDAGVQACTCAAYRCHLHLRTGMCLSRLLQYYSAVPRSCCGQPSAAASAGWQVMARSDRSSVTRGCHAACKWHWHAHRHLRQTA